MQLLNSIRKQYPDELFDAKIAAYLDKKGFTGDDSTLLDISDVDATYEMYVRNGELKLFKNDYPSARNFTAITATSMVKNLNYGINIGNSLDSKSNTTSSCGNDKYLDQEQAWGNPRIVPSWFEKVKSFGFNCVRIPITWFYNSHIDDNGDRKIGKYFKARAREVVDMALTQGLYVIINAHHEQPILYCGTDDTTFEQVVKDATDLWTDIADKFKHYGEKLIFEAYNELDNAAEGANYSSLACTQQNILNQKFVNIVRASGSNNEKRVLIIPTLMDSTKSNVLDDFVKPSDTIEDRIIVEVHLYSTLFAQNLDSVLDRIEKFSSRINAPVIIGEYGLPKSYELGDEMKCIHAQNFVARALKHGLKTFIWDDGGQFSFIPRNGNELSDTQTAIINSIKLGYKGLCYKLDEANVHIVSSIDDVEYGAPDSSGNVVYTHWGILTTKLYDVNIGDMITLFCDTNGKATNDRIWLSSISYYNSDGTFISKTAIPYGSAVHNCIIPDGVGKIRASYFSPHINVTKDSFSEYISNNSLICGLDIFTLSNIEEISIYDDDSERQLGVNYVIDTSLSEKAGYNTKPYYMAIIIDGKTYYYESDYPFYQIVSTATNYYIVYQKDTTLRNGVPYTTGTEVGVINGQTYYRENYIRYSQLETNADIYAL